MTILEAVRKITDKDMLATLRIVDVLECNDDEVHAFKKKLNWNVAVPTNVSSFAYLDNYLKLEIELMIRKQINYATAFETIFHYYLQCFSNFDAKKRKMSIIRFFDQPLTKIDNTKAEYFIDAKLLVVDISEI